MGGHVENEMKFTRQSSDSSCVLTRVLEFLVYNDYSVTKQSEKVYEDHYYDTPDLILFKNDCSARVRDHGNNKKMTIKIPITKENGIVYRKEIESVCDDYNELQSFVSSNYEDGIVLKEVVSLKTARNNIFFKAGREFTLSIDDCKLSDGNREANFIEIEIESIDNLRIDEFGLEGLTFFITKELGFNPTDESKYSRALRWKLSVSG